MTYVYYRHNDKTARIVIEDETDDCFDDLVKQYPLSSDFLYGKNIIDIDDEVRDCDIEITDDLSLIGWLAA